MLILSRAKNEEIVIGGNIVIKVVGLGGSDVRLGITAPKDVTVHRREVQERIDAEKEQEAKE